MRLITLSLFASSLLMGASVAWAQTDSTDRPSPPSPTQELPPATDGGASPGDNTSYMGYPAWQAVPYGAYGGGYGGWHNGCGGPWGGDCDHGCGGCNSCCKPSLRCRLKALRGKLAAAFSRCRRCSSSCCGGCTSCCHSGDTPDYHGDLPMTIEQESAPAAPQSDLLPVPPPEPSGYDSSDNQPTSGAARVAAKRKNNMPRTDSAKSRKTRRQSSVK
ncbi:MAG: hypothetical protein ACREJM_15465 [Candidatus Saccharimonadales bacterium]